MKNTNSRKIDNRGRNFPGFYPFLCGIALIAAVCPTAVSADPGTSQIVSEVTKKVDCGTLDGTEINFSYERLNRSVDEFKLIYLTVLTNLQNQIRVLRAENGQDRDRIAGLEKDSRNLRDEYRKACDREREYYNDLIAGRRANRIAGAEAAGLLAGLEAEREKLRKDLMERNAALRSLADDFQELAGRHDRELADNRECNAELAREADLIRNLGNRITGLSNGLILEKERTTGLLREQDVAARNLEAYRKLTGELQDRNLNLSNRTARLLDTLIARLNQDQMLSEELARGRILADALSATNARLLERLMQEQARSGELSGDIRVLADEMKKFELMADRLRGRNSELSNDLIAERNRASEVSRKYDESKSTYDNLISELQQEIENGKVTVNRIKDKLTVNLIDKILFNSGSIVINDEGLVVLAKIAQVLKRVDGRRVQIEGHTDNVPITSSLKEKFPTNWELASLRAVTVVRYLTETCGLNPENISAAGYSEYKPVEPNDTAEGRYNNRRIEIILTPLDRIVEQLP